MDKSSDKAKQLFVLDPITSSLRVLDKPSREELPKLELDASLQDDPDARYLYNTERLPSWLIELMKPQERKDRCKGPIPFDDDNQTRMEQFVGAFLVSSFAKTHNAESTTGKVYKYLVENGIREPTFSQVQKAYENIVLKVKNKYFYEKARFILQKRDSIPDPTPDQIVTLEKELHKSNIRSQDLDGITLKDLPTDPVILDTFLSGVDYPYLVGRFSSFSDLYYKPKGRRSLDLAARGSYPDLEPDGQTLRSKKHRHAAVTVSQNELPKLDLDPSLRGDEDALYLYNTKKLPSWLLEMMTPEQRQIRRSGTIEFNAKHQARMAEFLQRYRVASKTKTNNASKTTERIYRYLVENGVQEPTIQQAQSAYENIVLKIKNNYFHEKAKFIWMNTKGGILPTDETIQQLAMDLREVKTPAPDFDQFAISTAPSDPNILNAFLDKERPLAYEELVKRYSTFHYFQPTYHPRGSNAYSIKAALSAQDDQVPDGLWVQHTGAADDPDPT